MARIQILSGSVKATISGYDPRYATNPDHFLLNTDHLPDQVVAAGFVAFGGGNTASVAVPSLYSEYKIDFFYCAIASGVVSEMYLPDSLTGLVVGVYATQLTLTFSGGNVNFTRRGNIAGVANRGVRYVMYATQLP